MSQVQSLCETLQVVTATTLLCCHRSCHVVVPFWCLPLSPAVLFWICFASTYKSLLVRFSIVSYAPSATSRQKVLPNVQQYLLRSICTHDSVLSCVFSFSLTLFRGYRDATSSERSFLFLEIYANSYRGLKVNRMSITWHENIVGPINSWTSSPAVHTCAGTFTHKQYTEEKMFGG